MTELTAQEAIQAYMDNDTEILARLSDDDLKKIREWLGNAKPGEKVVLHMAFYVNGFKMVEV